MQGAGVAGGCTARSFTPKPGQSVDHENGNGLDNRKDNLRLRSQAENCRNKNIHYNSKTGFKGVLRRRQAFTASIRFGGRLINLGSFDNAQDAAKAYDQAAIRYYGQFARTNFHVPGFQCANDKPPKHLAVATKARTLSGEKNPHAKLSSKQVRAIRYAFKSASCSSLAKVFNVGTGAIWEIRTGKSYQSI
jgi:hypothetical protein